MDLFEHQAKRLISDYGIPIPVGETARTVDQAGQAAHRIGAATYVVKAQVLAGDRKRAGGIRFAATPAEVQAAAGQLIGSRLVTSQTGGVAAPVTAVHVEEMVRVAQNLYLAITVDKRAGRIVMLASKSGGEDIEARVGKDDQIVERLPLTLSAQKLEGDFTGLAQRIETDARVRAGLVTLMRNLAAAFVGLDATQAEINPLAVTPDGQLVALDAKISIDDNALFRRPDLAKLRDASRSPADPSELEAQAHQINYMRLEGDIGLVVNGAGLALATHDLIVDAGGRPANFMDIRTTATSLDIAHGMGLILKNPAVRSVFVNVHGGGMQRCDTIAEGIGVAMRRSGRRLPIVIRMAGNNAAFAATVLKNNGVDYIDADDMSDGAAAAVAAARREAA
ncbi:MAG: ADP-forming succinate--CoA ligase subunit beta [Hyphomicrobiaceae bacterium]|nr:ADP-forming succinate--CoA ligase subunit beta [Hyphomicrobiaceae bacterium]MCC0007295.1 ADP-forming succinate--CoA ligase subunit beta [Hyphomicrobiaceae bacterium]